MRYCGEIHTFKFEPAGITLKVPPWHRSATGLLSKTKVYLYPRKTNNGIREVVVSPFHPGSWAYIWRLDCSSTDRPGLIRDITKVLREEQVNLFIQESPITDSYQDFTVSFVADFLNYFKSRKISISGKVEPPQLQKFQDEIQTAFSQSKGTGDEAKRIE